MPRSKPSKPTTIKASAKPARAESSRSRDRSDKKAAPARPKSAQPKKTSTKKPTGPAKPVSKTKPAPKKKPVKKAPAQKPVSRKSETRTTATGKAKPTTTDTKKTGAADAKVTAASKKTSGGKTAKKTSSTPAPPPTPEAAPPAGDKGSPAKKGLTASGAPRRPHSKSKAVSKYSPPIRPMLLGPGSKFNKPLIPSGPSAPKVTSLTDAPRSRRTKSPLTKAKLDKYRGLLIAKRAELLGDVESMENEALRSDGGLSHTPQHIAEQGSESFDQALSLNLAAQDRRLIKEIDDALKRIEDGGYGLCELTNLPIPEARLDELPWARHTIEAARELETRGPSQ